MSVIIIVIIRMLSHLLKFVQASLNALLHPGDEHEMMVMVMVMVMNMRSSSSSDGLSPVDGLGKDLTKLQISVNAEISIPHLEWFYLFFQLFTRIHHFR